MSFDCSMTMLSAPSKAFVTVIDPKIGLTEEDSKIFQCLPSSLQSPSFRSTCHFVRASPPHALTISQPSQLPIPSSVAGLPSFESSLNADATRSTGEH